MKFRKVQEVGRGTLLISLPKDWARRMGVKRGGFVAVWERGDGCLVVDPSYGRMEEASKITITFAGKDEEKVRWEVLGAYLLGYDIIEIKTEGRINPEARERIKAAIENLIGLEILEEDSSRLVAQCLIDPSAVAPKKLLHRENTITVGMHRDAVTSLLRGDRRLAQLVVKRDDEVDRIHFLIVRLLRSAVRNPRLADKFAVTSIDCLDYRVVANVIEAIGDYAVEMAEVYLGLPKDVKREDLSIVLREVSEILCEMQNLAVGAFLAKKINLVGKVKIDLHHKLIERLNHLDRLVAKEDTELIPGLNSISASLAKIGRCCVDIADLVIPLS